MTKKEAINTLYEIEPESGIIEIICDITTYNNIAHNQSILIKIYDNCADDQILNNKHWNIYNSINDFINCLEFNRNNIPSKFHISNFKQVKSFITDFK